jgi:hypothetical protein
VAVLCVQYSGNDDTDSSQLSLLVIKLNIMSVTLDRVAEVLDIPAGSSGSFLVKFRPK